MKERTSFDPQGDLIYITAQIWGPSGDRFAKLALDTASAEVLLVPDLVDMIGYSVRDAIEITSVTSAVGKEIGYRLQTRKFAALGFEADNFPINVHDLPDDCGFQGLLGLRFLRHLNYEIRSIEGVIFAEQLNLP